MRNFVFLDNNIKLFIWNKNYTIVLKTQFYKKYIKKNIIFIL